MIKQGASGYEVDDEFIAQLDFRGCEQKSVNTDLL